MNTSGIDYPEILQYSFEKHYNIQLNENNINNEIEDLILQYYFSEYFFK